MDEIVTNVRKIIQTIWILLMVFGSTVLVISINIDIDRNVIIACFGVITFVFGILVGMLIIATYIFRKIRNSTSNESDALLMIDLH